MDPRPTAPTPELEEESPQEELRREQPAEPEDPAILSRTEICRALVEPGALRNEELKQRIGFSGDTTEWKARLWHLHNEGYVKVRWVGLADPDPVEVRLTERGRDWLAPALVIGPGKAAGAGSAGGGSRRG